MNKRYISQASAAKLCGVDRSRITQLKNKNIPPSYFVKVKDDVSGEMFDMVDSENKEFLNYKQRKEIDGQINSNSFQQKLIKAVIDFLREDMGLSGDALSNAVRKLQKRFEEK